MRLWSIHPKYLDSKGLVALWREGLLAKKVLAGRTKGYKNHPQLERFKKHKNPSAAINAYLSEVLKEARVRGYSFNPAKIKICRIGNKITVTRGQAAYELKHLKKKLGMRNLEGFNRLKMLRNPELNNIFRRMRGPVESWEKV